jgi:hypothetical protein
VNATFGGSEDEQGVDQTVKRSDDRYVGNTDIEDIAQPKYAREAHA